MHEGITFSLNEAVSLRSTPWVQLSLKQLHCSTMHPPIHLCISSPQPGPTSNTWIMLRCSGGDTLLQWTHTHGESEWERERAHTNCSSLTLPRCSQTFMSVGFSLSSTLDVQSAAMASVSTDWVSLRCSQAHQAFCFYPVWFHFVFVSCHFVVLSWHPFLKRQVSKTEKKKKRKQTEKKKKPSPPGVRLNHVRTTTGRGHSEPD